MGQERRRTCVNCGESFIPDPRNTRHQRYCAQPACRAASKRASQAKWLARPENRDYHRGPAAVARVRAWRQAHPGYSRRKTAVPIADPAAMPVVPAPLQGSLPIASGAALQDVMGSPLQAILAAQPYVLIGLISHLLDCALQEAMPHAA